MLNLYFFQRSGCDPSNCTCVPATNKCYHNEYQIPLDANKMNISHGRNEMDFYFVLRVTNTANLQNTKTFKVLIIHILLILCKESVVFDLLLISEWDFCIRYTC